MNSKEFKALYQDFRIAHKQDGMQINSTYEQDRIFAYCHSRYGEFGITLYNNMEKMYSESTMATDTIIPNLLSDHEILHYYRIARRILFIDHIRARLYADLVMQGIDMELVKAIVWSSRKNTRVYKQQARTMQARNDTLRLFNN